MSAAALAAALAAVSGWLGLVELWAALVGQRRSRRRGDGNRGTGSAGAAGARSPRLRRLLSWGPALTSREPGDLRARLLAAGEPLGLGPREWMAAKGICSLAALAGAAAMAASAPPRVALVVMPSAVVTGYLLPDLWLARWSRQRAQAALRELPDMLDLLRVTLEAGLPTMRALGVVAAEFDGSLAREWRRAAAEAALGLPQEEAVAGIALRLPGEELRLLAEALGRSRRHGGPLGRVLAAQASRACHRLRHQVREHAARAGPKIQLVVALLLVPSVLLMVAAGIVAELERSGLGLPS